MMRIIVFCSALGFGVASQAAPWGRLFSDAAQRAQPRASAAAVTTLRLSACAWANQRKRCWVDGQPAASSPAQVRVGESWSVQP